MKHQYQKCMGRDHFKVLRILGLDRRIILKCIFKTYGVRVWDGFIWLRIATSGGIL
jgi:hypothetical protein